MKPYWECDRATLYQGSVLDVLPCLDAGSVQCCVTSPPYWGLRDYGCEGQIGLESTPEAYVAKLVQVFAEVWRVLRDDGTLWLNLGSSYASSPPGIKAGGVSGKSTLHGVESSVYRNTLENSVGQRRSTIVAGGNEPFVLRDDLTPNELAYVFAELAAHIRKGNEVPVPD